jgi:hypothetical protein
MTQKLKPFLRLRRTAAESKNGFVERQLRLLGWTIARNGLD